MQASKVIDNAPFFDLKNVVEFSPWETLPGEEIPLPEEIPFDEELFDDGLLPEELFMEWLWEDEELFEEIVDAGPDVRAILYETVAEALIAARLEFVRVSDRMITKADRVAPTIELNAGTAELTISGKAVDPFAVVTVTLYSDPKSVSVTAEADGGWSAAIDLTGVDEVVKHTLTVKTANAETNVETPEVVLGYVRIPPTSALLDALPTFVADGAENAMYFLSDARATIGENVITPVVDATKKVVTVTAQATTKAAKKTAEVTVKTAKVTHEVVVKTEPQTKATLSVVLPVVAVVNPPMVATLPSLPFIVYHALTWVLSALGIRTRRTPWGVVYDAITKEPIALTIVRLADAASNRVVETQVTDRSGRFGFLLKPGTYHIEATKAGYTFPSIIITGSGDGQYQPVYRKETLTITSSGQMVTMAIPLDPVNVKAPVVRSAMKGLWNAIGSTTRKLHLPVMIVGAIIALLVAVNIPTLANIAMAASYLLVAFFQQLVTPSQPKPWGTIFDAMSLQPVALALVDIIDTKYNKLLKSRLSDYEGRFAFLPPKGTYKLNVRKAGFKFPVPDAKSTKKFKNLYRGEEVVIAKDEGIIAKDIPIEKADVGQQFSAAQPQPSPMIISPVPPAPLPSPSASSDHHELLGADHESNVSP